MRVLRITFTFSLSAPRSSSADYSSRSRWCSLSLSLATLVTLVQSAFQYDFELAVGSTHGMQFSTISWKPWFMVPTKASTSSSVPVGLRERALCRAQLPLATLEAVSFSASFFYSRRFLVGVSFHCHSSSVATGIWSDACPRSSLGVQRTMAWWAFGIRKTRSIADSWPRDFYVTESLGSPRVISLAWVTSISLSAILWYVYRPLLFHLGW